MDIDEEYSIDSSSRGNMSRFFNVRTLRITATLFSQLSLTRSARGTASGIGITRLIHRPFTAFMCSKSRGSAAGQLECTTLGRWVFQHSHHQEGAQMHLHW